LPDELGRGRAERVSKTNASRDGATVAQRGLEHELLRRLERGLIEVVSARLDDLRVRDATLSVQHQDEVDIDRLGNAGAQRSFRIGHASVAL